METLLLSGGTRDANFVHLAHAWGRDRGFHNVLVSTVCSRRGEIERKRRSDFGTKGAAKREKKQAGEPPPASDPSEPMAKPPPAGPSKPPAASRKEEQEPQQQQQQQQQWEPLERPVPDDPYE